VGFTPFERALEHWWAVRIPLARIGPTERERAAALAHRLAKAETDPWAFEDLRAFAGALRDAGEPVPPALDAWVWEVALERRTKPNRKKGERGDPLEELAAATAYHGPSKPSYEELGAYLDKDKDRNSPGNAMSKSAASRMVKRGRRYLIGSRSKIDG